MENVNDSFLIVKNDQFIITIQLFFIIIIATIYKIRKNVHQKNIISCN
jgi:hypothetical protein